MPQYTDAPMHDRGLALPPSAWPGLDHGLRARPDTAAAAVRGLAAAGAVGAIALLVREFDAAVVAAGVVLCGAAVLLLVLPELATLAVVFLLYTNIPALAAKHGLPYMVASSFMLLLALPLVHHVLIRRQRLRMDASLALMLAYVVVLLLSSLGAKGPQLAVMYVRSYLLEGVLLYWLLINAVRSRATFGRVVRTVLAAGALLAALTGYQEAAGTFDQQFGGLARRNYEYMQLQQRAEESPEAREALQKVRFHHRSRRPGGPFGEPNRFAQILVVLLPLCVWAYRTARTRRSRGWVALCGVSILGGIVLTGSRGAFLVVVVVAMAAAVLRWVRPSRIAAGALALALFLPILVPGFIERAASLAALSRLSRDPTSADEVDGAIRGRATEMLAAFKVFADHPVLGVGPGQFAPFYVIQYSQDPSIKFRDVRETMRAHNLYLEIAAEVGFVGLTIFLSIIGVLLHGLWRERRRWMAVRPEYADLATALWLSLGAYLLSGMTMHLSYQRYYWFLLAIAAAGLHLLRLPGAAEAAPDPSRRSGPLSLSPR